MVYVSGISAAYALAFASAAWVDIVAAKAWLFFVPDQIVEYMMATSTAAVADLLYLAYNGDRDVTWSKACSSYAAFCDNTRLTLILHFVALSCFFAHAIISAYRMFRDFNPPLVPKEEEE